MSNTTTEKRKRFQFKFWLDVNKLDQLELGRELETLKRNRQFQPTIIKAMKLFISLMQGRVDLLLEEFPFVRDELKNDDPPPTLASDDFERMLKYQAMILEQLQRNPVQVSSREETTQPALPGMMELEDLAASVFIEAPKTEEQIMAEASAARVEFAAGLGDMFNEDDSELWD